MQQQQPQDEPTRVTMRDSFNILYILVSAHTACLTPFLRHNFGAQALGFSGAAALGLMVVYGSLNNSPGMFVFLCIWLYLVLMHRIKSARLRRQGVVMHSRFEGRPWAAFLVPGVRRESTAEVIEMAICAFVGACLTEYDHALGLFVFCGVLSMLVKSAIDQRTQDVRLQQMRDAEIEQRALVQRMQGRLEDY